MLCKLFGLVHIEIAEDIATDTFVLATETWKTKGIPENPTAWLYVVAKNKTKDYLKRDQIFSEKIAVELRQTSANAEEIELDLSAKNSSDSQLQMIFAICNPQIPAEAQIGLALRILCGFGIDEIAEAFLTNKETINKRLFRAKETLRSAAVTLEMPSDLEINNRLETVLTTLYLLFNEGYHSSTRPEHLRKELCVEAMRLTYFLLENNSTNRPSVNALMALMCFHSSRFDARTTQLGEPILYENQDKNLWDEALIEKGNFYLIESAKGQEISKYHLEASIAYWHTTKLEHPNKWENVLQLYNHLLQINYSPIAALNRTYALSKVSGKETALREALKLDLSGNHLYFSLLGNLYTDVDNLKAIEAYNTALKFAKSQGDRQVIQTHLDALNG